LAAGFLIVLFSLALLWHDPLIFWNDDYELSILPVFADVARSWHEGHLPLLSSYSWVCGNLAGEFQYGTFSVFVNAAVILIWKFPLTFPQQAAALSIAHLFVLAMGAYLLARGRDLSRPLSMLVAVVAALNGWIICWGATDWFGALGAFAWLPWCWWSLERALRADGSRGRFLWPAPFVYLLVTGGFPYTVVMLALLVAWLSLRAFFQTRRWMSVAPMLAGVALGFGLSAPAWLALLAYVHGSNRSVESATAHWQWLVPPAALPGFFLPSWTVKWADFSTRYLPHTATELACGLVPPVALLWGFMVGGRAFVRRINWELGLLGITLLLSMAPSTGVFRWSFRWLPLIHLILVLCAAEALRVLREKDHPRWAGPGVPAFVSVGLLSAFIYMGHLGGRYPFPLIWISLGLSGLWALSDFVRPRLSAEGWILSAIAFTSLLATYLCIPPNCGVPKYNLSQTLTTAEPLERDRLYLAVYSPAEYAYRREFKQGPVGQVARPGSTSMWAGLRFINGYSPILPAGVAREFKFFIHGEIDADMGRHLVTNQAGPGGLLEQLGVDGLVIAREIQLTPNLADWALAFENDEGSIFHRRESPLGLVRSVSRIESRPGEEFSAARVTNIRDERNALEFEVEVPDGGRPALLAVSRPFFPGYRARLGPARLSVGSYKGLIPTVEVPAGSHGHVILAYCPGWLEVGAAVSVLSGLILIAGLVRTARA
jgi:hypothetical protein